MVAAAIRRIVPKPNPGTCHALLLLAPVLLYLLAFFIIPLSKLVIESFRVPANYARLFTEPLYVRVLLSTVELALAVTACCLVFGYAFALAMTRVGPQLRNVMLIAVLLPYWTSVLVRSYAWLTILQKEGIVNQILLGIGIVREPVQFVYNFSGVVWGMSYIMLPYMVLVLYTSIRGIEEQLVLVAWTLGSTRGEAFRKIVVPLSLPGILAGSALVFILSLGYFITPALLGGRREITFSMLIDIQMNQLLDWRFGAALSFFLLVITGLALLGLNRISRVRIPLAWIP